MFSVSGLAALTALGSMLRYTVGLSTVALAIGLEGQRPRTERELLDGVM